MPSIQAIDPASGVAFAETPATAAEELPGILARARAAQRSWAGTTLAERKRVITRFQQRLYAQRQELAELITRENGKPVAEALLTDVAVTLDLARYYRTTASRLLRPRRIRPGNPAFLGKRGWLHWDPLGVVAIISPWNYPLLLPFGELLPALLAGNAVVVKPSEYTTRTLLRGVELLHAAGCPTDLCQVLVGDGRVGAALIAAGPDKVFFTGSPATGRQVALAAAERLIPVNLELGGSDPLLVLADADLDRTVSGAIWARFTNGGQTCVAAKRIIVERPVYQPFLQRLLERVALLVLGPGSQPGTDVGPIIRESQVLELERQLAASVALGARVRLGGRRRPDLGPTFFEPTVITDVPPDAPVWQEETFGPIMPVVAVDDVEAAVRLANNSTFGLSASVWTRDRTKGLSVARQLHAGAVLVNDAASHVGTAEVPHGGEKTSGLGRTHGELGFQEVCRPRFVGTDLLDGIRKPWWFGYNAASTQDRDAFLRFAFAPSWRERLGGVRGALRLLRNRRPI
jgi:succinate-semialdehyde dehydrogenase/glutarate-semialdehyde dehydrogenase